jgi:hypothetical protein
MCTHRLAALAALLCALAVAGCAPREAIQARGLSDFGLRYAWTKPAADDLERRRDMLACAEIGQAGMETATSVAMVPVLGLLALPGLVAEERAMYEGRAACMEARGWQLVDVTTGQPQRIYTAPLGAVRLEPRAPQTAQAR